MATVQVEFSPLPAHVRTARLIATAVARRAGVPEEYLDEVRLAVGEACSRAVGVHQRVAPGSRVGLTILDEQGRFSVEVSDVGGMPAPPEAVDLHTLDPERIAAGTGDGGGELLPPGFELAVISGLVDEVTVESGSAGTRVRMTWPARDPMAPEAAESEDRLG